MQKLRMNNLAYSKMEFFSTHCRFIKKVSHKIKLKNAVFWDVAPCRYCVTRRFGRTYHLHLQGIKIR
jgi:hypothetical protein